jgi:xylose isomerase
MAGKYCFSFGPWNIHTGSDPFGPEAREPFSWEDKLPMYKRLGFDGVQLHDDDAVSDLNNLTDTQIKERVKLLELVRSLQ